MPKHLPENCPTPALFVGKLGVPSTCSVQPPDDAHAAVLMAHGVNVRQLRCDECGQRYHLFPTIEGVDQMVRELRRG